MEVFEIFFGFDNIRYVYTRNKISICKSKIKKINLEIFEDFKLYLYLYVFSKFYVYKMLFFYFSYIDNKYELILKF